MPSAKKALISGATGYIGSKLCEQLLSNGWQVTAIVRSDGRVLPAAWAGQVTELAYDGGTQSLIDGVATAQPDVVFHLASLFIAEHRTDQVTDLINSNVLFGTQLIEACARAGVKQFINTGTSWQHYRSDAYDPVCLYAATKQALEDILDFYSDAFLMKVITLKLFDTYGPGDPRSKIVNLLLRAARSGELLGMSPGEQALDLVHIDDVTLAFVRCAEHSASQAPGSHERYAVSSGHSLSLRELAALIADIGGSPLNISFGDRPYRQREVMKPSGPANPPPGWTPQVSLQAGLKAIIELKK